MKRTMTIMVVAVMVVLLGIPEKAQAGPWTNFAFGRSSYGGYSGRGYYSPDRTLGRVRGYGGLAMNVLHGLNQISADSQAIEMAKKEQEFRHQQIIAQQIRAEKIRAERIRAQQIRAEQIRARQSRVQQSRAPAAFEAKRLEKTQAAQSQENEKLRKEVEALELKLAKLRLEKEIEKAKK